MLFTWVSNFRLFVHFLWMLLLSIYWSNFQIDAIFCKHENPFAIARMILNKHSTRKLCWLKWVFFFAGCVYVYVCVIATQNGFLEMFENGFCKLKREILSQHFTFDGDTVPHHITPYHTKPFILFCCAVHLCRLLVDLLRIINVSQIVE